MQRLCTTDNAEGRRRHSIGSRKCHALNGTTWLLVAVRASLSLRPSPTPTRRANHAQDDGVNGVYVDERRCCIFRVRAGSEV